MLDRNNTAVGTTIKLEEFEKLPVGLIKGGVITNDQDGIDCRLFYKGKYMLYRVIKHSNQDWGLYASQWDDSYNLIDNLNNAEYYEDSLVITDNNIVKSIFNCSKKVMNLIRL